MLIALFFLAVVVAGLVFMAHGIMNAPLGEQTELGFEMTWCNDEPEYRNVSCVWTECPA